MNNNIEKEPTISVGIILPEDKKTSLVIEFPNPKQYKINLGQLSEKLIITSQDHSIIINGKISDRIEIEPIKIDGKINPACVKTTADKHPIIQTVPTGRGFHWQNEIQVQLPGKIIIQNHNGYLFVINELPVEQYLPYVATSEMNPDCPPALLEAQTIAARSWLLANRKVNHPELDIDVCNDDCCQRYQGVMDVPDQSLQAIQKTYGQVLQYRPSFQRTGNEICDARYSKCCGGITESYENVWGGKPISYLSSVPDIPNNLKNQITLNDIKTDRNFKTFLHTTSPTYCSPNCVKPKYIQKYLGKVDKSDSYYRWDITYSQKELTTIINQKLDLHAKAVIKFISLKRGFSGRIIKLKINYVNKSGQEESIILNSEYDIRNALHKQFLYSSAIIIEQKTKENSLPKNFKFTGAGWGHGVGLCQIGALGMALNGYSSENILKHYFSNTKIEKIY